MGAADFASTGWAAARVPAALPGNLVLGVCLGSGYQAYFSELTDPQQNAEVGRMKNAGITWVRMDVTWNTVQQASGSTYVFDYPDLAVTALQRNGMNIVALLNESPKWARQVGNNPGAPSCPFKTFTPADFAAFCGQAAQHYGPKGVQVFEVWNEPNLDSGYGSTDGAGYDPADPQVYTTPLGLGPYSPPGYAALATAAYQAIHAQYQPPSGTSIRPLVLGGALGIHHSLDSLDTGADTRPGCSWPAVSQGAQSAVVSCATAKAADQYAFISDNTGHWPAGTYVASVVPGVSLTLAPPSWTTGFAQAIAQDSAVTLRVDFGCPADTFLTGAYAAAAGQPMFDALSTHPYAFPELPATQNPKSGGWNLTPAVRKVMTDNGDGAKAVWFTEFGAPTGAATAASVPATAASATSLTATGPAAAADVGYLVTGAGLPAGSYVGAVTKDSSWTLLPTTGLTVDATSNTLSGGAQWSGVYVQAAKALEIPQNTTLIICFGAGDSTAPVTAVTDQAYSIPVTSAGSPAKIGFTTAVTLPNTPTGTIPPIALAAGGPVLALSSTGLTGQTWGAAVPAAENAALTLLAPGVADSGGLSAEEQQSAIIQQSLNAIAHGVPGIDGQHPTPPWPYIGPVFVYCWSDASLGSNAGPFGLTRADGSAKAALTVLTAFGPGGSVADY